MNGIAKIVLCSCLLGASQHAVAQNDYFVKGVLVDSLLNESEPYATVRIFPAGNSEKPLKVGVTDNDGKFKEALPKPGEYRLTISSLGKQTVDRRFSVSAAVRTADLDTLYTAESSVVLKGVDVVALKPLVKAEIDKISYSVKDDPDAQTNTALEMLRKVPMVTVDGEDNIQLNGSSSFKVYVNGKPNTLMSNNPKEVLRSLPASSIKSIEVITDPGAKYDAEGVGGILNIVTTDMKMQGYNVSLGTGVTNRDVNAYGYGTVQYGKFTMSVNYSYNHQMPTDSYSTSLRENFTSDDSRYLSTLGTNDTKGNFQFANIQGSYEMDTLNLLTFSLNLFDGKYNTDGSTLTKMEDVQRNPIYSYNMLTDTRMEFGNVGVDVDYQHSFKRKGEYLTVSYKFNNSPNNSETLSDYSDLTDVPFTLTDQYFDKRAHTMEHTGQVDYVNPITDMHYVDAGLKYIFRQNASDSKYYDILGDGTRTENQAMSSDYDQRQSIVAVYADYQLKWKKLGFKAGVRYEHTFTDVAYALTPERNFDAGFDDVVPSANLAYMITPASNLKLNYNMRINRPGIWYLNPFRDTSNPNVVSYGNPDLESEKSHNVSLTYGSFSAKFNINATLSYMFVNNGIEGYSFMNGDIMESTFRNVGKTKKARLSLWANWNPSVKTRLSVNASSSYADFRSVELNAENSGFDANGFVNFQQTLPWDLNLSVFGGGGSPRVMLQGKSGSYYYYGASLSKGFLKEKRLNVSLHASNFFSDKMSYKNETITDTFRNITTVDYSTMRYGISISWRFGDLKAQVKQTARSITNDDVKAGGDQQQGGGAPQGGK